ncbi:MAG: hypothetical protein ABSA47_02300 [Verrucomicrobiota bacterium]
MKIGIAAAWLAILIPAQAAPNAPQHVYSETSAKAVHKIGSDLFETLDEKYQKNVDPDMIRVETLDAPVITPIPGTAENKKLNQVFVSAGYIDLINHIAHAKAIDHIQPGYFAQYIQNLARDAGGAAPPEPPNMVDNRYWSDDVMNSQISYFNQMLGMTMALSLSHHYLGHFNKYANQMLAGKLVPINGLLAQAEWEETVKKATLNSLNCALGTDGVKSLFDAIDKMPQRPAWTAFIVPQGVDLKQLNKTLAKYEDMYFHGGLK